MKTKTNIAYKKLIFEFISISFAVFLGLMLNQWKDNYNNKQIVQQSLDNIQVEVEKNTSRVQDMLNSHETLLAKIDKILINIDHGKILSDSLGNISFQLLNSTAWETAKLTQAIAHMDINIVSEIAGIYEYQEYYESTVKQYYLSNPPSPSFESEKDIRENKTFFIGLRDFLKLKIVPSESNLLEYYKELQTDILASTKN